MELLSDEALAVVVPVVVYWAYCGLHIAFGRSIYLDKYRLHPSCHEDSKNYVSKREVAITVVKLQLVQLAVVTLALKVAGGTTTSAAVQTSYLKMAFQFAVAMIWYDGWQYAWHRIMHTNRFLYRNLHCWHHRIVVPYVFGTIYGHPIEGLIVDTLGGTIAFLVSGISPRASIFFFSLCTMKGIDNHCGLSLPFELSFLNSAAYHDLHHQLRGGQYNYSQLFFVFWDKVFGTYMPYLIEDRPEGMLQVRAPDLDFRSQK